MKVSILVYTGAMVGLLLTASDPAPVTLKSAYQDDFLIGAALGPAQFSGTDTRMTSLIKAQFNSISPGNVLKWASVHPQPGRYDFTSADRYVAFGQENRMFIVGHNLVWHNQTPSWVFQDAEGKPVDRETLLTRMRDHIFTVVGRYRGKIGGWDVVNEALNSDGTLRQSPWEKIIGDDYVEKAYQFAHEADPGAELYYNDYALEDGPKRQGAIALVKKLLAEGIPLSAVGLQGHYRLDWPDAGQIDETIGAFSQLGVKVMITELDVDVLPAASHHGDAETTLNFQPMASLNPYPQVLPDAVQQALAKRYADLFGVFLRHRGQLNRVTFWGVTDADSWLNNWPVRGRTSYPLLFDRTGQPKLAYSAVIHAAKP
jgi:endo-1,4-beta-xylanase